MLIPSMALHNGAPSKVRMGSSVLSVRRSSIILEVIKNHRFRQSFYYDLLHDTLNKINKFLLPVNSVCSGPLRHGLPLDNGERHKC
jgi:hypothetical protein